MKHLTRTRKKRRKEKKEGEVLQKQSAYAVTQVSEQSSSAALTSNIRQTLLDTGPQHFRFSLNVPRLRAQPSSLLASGTVTQASEYSVNVC